MVIRVLCFRTPSSGLNRLSTKVDYLFHIFDYDHFDLSMPKLINSIAFKLYYFYFFTLLKGLEVVQWDTADSNQIHFSCKHSG